MRKHTICLVALCLLTVPLQALTVEEVIAKHIDAHGGLENWQAIESLKLSGQFTGFSKTRPFTLLRQPGKYHLDHHLGDKHVVIGHDGEQTWWVNGWYGIDWAIPVSGPDLTALERDFDFPTPFFDYQEKGHQVKLVGEVDFEGQELLQLDVTRADGTEEQWYLDPETGLEVARTSPGSDFGNPMPQQTVFDDFREVGGVVIPHFTESQWYTRDRVMEIESVEVNVELDQDLFAFPPPAGMAVLAPMVGDWQVKLEHRSRPDAPFEETETSATITSLVDGALIQEQGVDEDGQQVVRTLSYDGFQKRYRMTLINRFTTHLDVQEGELDDDGRLVVSNVDTGTTWQGYGFTFFGRTSFADVSEDGFKVEQEMSMDGGENWFVIQKLTYTRAGD